MNYFQRQVEQFEFMLQEAEEALEFEQRAFEARQQNHKALIDDLVDKRDSLVAMVSLLRRETND